MSYKRIFGPGYVAATRNLRPAGRRQTFRRIVENRAIARAPIEHGPTSFLRTDISRPNSKWYGAPGTLRNATVQRAKAKHFLSGYITGMRGARPHPLLPNGVPARGPRRNTGSFETRKGTWKKGAGGRFVGSGG